jgi:glycosyltransferase involved in cell wall biosynthesis
MKEIMVSVIIPVYNVQDFIVSCLESVAAQTYKGSIECLIIDDCGHDDSVRLAENFIFSYNGTIDFRIIHHEINKGLSVARNTGIREAKGEWLYFLDSDDYIVADALELMMQCVKKTNVELVQAGCIYSNARSPFPQLDSNKNFPDIIENHSEIVEWLYKQYRLPMTSWNKLVSRNFILSNYLFFEEGVMHEDIPWLFRLAQKLSCIAICKHDTYHYCVRSNSIMGGDNLKHIKSWSQVLNICIDKVSAKGKNREIDYIFNHYLNKRDLYHNDMNVYLLDEVLDNLIKVSSGIRKVVLGLYKILPNRIRDSRKVCNWLDYHVNISSYQWKF